MKSSNSAKVQDLVKDKNWTQTLIHVHIPKNHATNSFQKVCQYVKKIWRGEVFFLTWRDKKSETILYANKEKILFLDSLSICNLHRRVQSLLKVHLQSKNPKNCILYVHLCLPNGLTINFSRVDMCFMSLLSPQKLAQWFHYRNIT